MNEEFDKWLESQDEATKNLISERFSRLEATVKATRQERDTLNTELKSLAKKIDKDSEAYTQLSELRERMEHAEKKSNFLELASRQGVIRPTAAYAIANSENLFLPDGTPDWEGIKASVPELFKVQNTNNNAGSGTNTNALPLRTANERIRDAASK